MTCFDEEPEHQPTKEEYEAYEAVSYDMRHAGHGVYCMTEEGMKYVPLGELYDLGASPEYIEKVKADLCGAFGRVMP